MSKVSPLINNFSGGEWGPLASARVDLERYKTSSETCLNYVPVLQGGLTRRPGTRYVTTAKVDTVVRLVPFVFSNDDKYILEFSDGCIRFFKNNAQVLLSGSPYELTASPYSAASIPDLKFVQSNDIIYIFHEDYTTAKLIRYSDNVWTLTGVSFLDGPYLPDINMRGKRGSTKGAYFDIYTNASTGAVVLTVALSRAITGVSNSGGKIQITSAFAADCNEGDRIFISGVGGTVEANGTWTIESRTNTTFILANSTYVNAFTVGGNVWMAIFDSTTDVGRLMRLKASTGDWGWGTITSVIDTHSVNFLVESAITFGPLLENYRFGVFKSVGTGTRPSSGCFHEDRLFTFGPGQYVCGSVTGDYENFAPSSLAGVVASSDGVVFGLNSNDTNNAQWIVSDEKGLVAGTNANEWLIKSASTTEAISPTSISAKKVTSFGSKNISPVQSGKAVLFIQSSGRKVREFNYFYDVDGFRCTDLTQLAHHIGESGITQMAIQKQPHSLVWCVRADGTLACLTYERDIEGLKVAWHRHELGGYQDSVGTPCDVLSIATIPSADGTYDELWLAVRRLINGVPNISIEYMTKFFDAEVEQEDAFFVDCGLTYDTQVGTIVNVDATGSPVEVEITAHGLTSGNTVRFDEFIGATELNGNIYTVNVTSADIFTLKDSDGNDIDGSDFTAWISGGECRKLVATISGLSHLNDQTVQVLGDGAVLNEVVVSAGSITLSEPSAVVQIGLGYNSDVKLPRLEAGSRDGTSLGKTQRIHRVGFMFDRSLGLSFGDSFDNLTPMEFQDANDQLNQAPALFSGIKSEEFTSDSNMENKICFRQSQPLPSTILAVIPQMVTEDR